MKEEVKGKDKGIISELPNGQFKLGDWIEFQLDNEERYAGKILEVYSKNNITWVRIANIYGAEVWLNLNKVVLLNYWGEVAPPDCLSYKRYWNTKGDYNYDC